MPQLRINAFTDYSKPYTKVSYTIKNTPNKCQCLPLHTRVSHSCVFYRTVYTTNVWRTASVLEDVQKFFKKIKYAIPT